MKKTFFMVYVEGQSTPTMKHDTREKAEEEATRLSKKHGKDAFVLESVVTIEPEEINKKVNSYGAAMGYLGYDKIACMCGIEPKHEKAMEAIYKLIVIAEAWNKADGFVPDYDNRNQEKWFPWFKKTPAGFVCSYTSYAASYSSTSFGSRLCFKTSERARQFGEQFAELWNDFLLFR